MDFCFNINKNIWIVILALVFISSCEPRVHRKLQSHHHHSLYYGVDCERNCTLDPEPRACYYNFTLELYTTNNVVCNFCTPNATNYVSNDCQCVYADGIERTYISTNRMLPGPAIYVCLNDEIIVDVTNTIQGEDLTIHWHGIEQKGTQYYDGVPYVTQCPIDEGDTFRYQFLAAKSGTYYWHSHIGISKANGIVGSLVVRESRLTDVNAMYFEYDKWEHTMLIQDWLHKMAEDVFPGRYRSETGQLPPNFLINGKGNYTNATSGETTNAPLAVFEVKQNYSYRFRLINACAAQCPVQLIVQDHDLLLIAMDGKDIEPVLGHSIISMTGERYDFVINASQPIGSYWMQLVGIGECTPNALQQLAILKYAGADNYSLEYNPPPTFENQLEYTVTINPLDGNCTNFRPDAYCLNQINDSQHDPDIWEILYTDEEDVMTIYVPVDIYIINDLQEFFTAGNYSQFQVGGQEPPALNVFATFNTMSFVAPPSPLISQYDDIPADKLCDYSKCWNATKPCFCANVQHIPLGAVVDMVIVDTVFLPNIYHPIHLHGQSFYVLAIGHAEDIDEAKISVEKVIEARDKGKIPCRTHGYHGHPPRKDTLALPSNGFAIVRFKADNPGFWTLHCHIDYHTASGMLMVWQVGNLTDLPPVPTGFPTCGEYLPEINTEW